MVETCEQSVYLEYCKQNEESIKQVLIMKACLKYVEEKD